MDQKTPISLSTHHQHGINCRVLLVDDNKINQFLGKRILSNLGINNVELASGGEEALDKIGREDFDVILTDVEMPGMTGYELSRTIRKAEPSNHRYIIIALTANASDEDRAEAKAAGIDDYLTKPYNPQDLLDSLRKHLNHPRHGEMEEMQKGPYGIERVYALFNHQENDVLHFLNMLQQQLPVLIQEIRDGLLTDRQEMAFMAAHKLKSPVKLLAPPLFCDQFSDFTESLRKNPARIPATSFDAFEQELSGLLVLINTTVERLK